MTPDEPKTIRLKDYAPPPFLIESVSLTFALDPDRTAVKSRLSVRRNPESDRSSKDLRLDGEALELTSLRLDEERLDQSGHDLDDSGLTIKDVPDAFTLDIETTCNPAANTKLLQPK